MASKKSDGFKKSDFGLKSEVASLNLNLIYYTFIVSMLSAQMDSEIHVFGVLCL